MHRNRVTSELHDSYFRLMTIKHAIPKIEWAIEWALNYYITQSRQVVRQLKLETRCGRESHARPKGLSGPPMEFWRPVGDEMQLRKPSSSRELGPWASGWAALENEKDTTLTKEWGSKCCSYVRSLTPSHTQTLSNPFRTLTIKWEVHIFIKKSSLVLYPCVFVIHSACICMCICRWICIWKYNIISLFFLLPNWPYEKDLNYVVFQKYIHTKYLKKNIFNYRHSPKEMSQWCGKTCIWMQGGKINISSSCIHNKLDSGPTRLGLAPPTYTVLH